MKFFKALMIPLSLFVFSTFKVSAQEIVRSLDIQNFINKDGTVNIIETVHYDFGNEQKHGIFRDIPYKKINDEKKSFVMQIDISGVTDANGVPYKYSVEKSDKYVSLKIGDADKTVSGPHTYVISYTVRGALTYFNDFDEFYWNSIGGEWLVNISSVRSSVIFSDEFVEGQLKGVCYTGPIDSNEKNCTSVVGKNQIVFEGGPVYPGSAFTVAVDFPKGYAAQLEPQPDKTEWYQAIVKALFAVAAFVFYLGLPIFLSIKWLSDKKKLANKAKIVSAWFSAPKTIDGETLNPVETSIAATGVSGKKDLAAVIVSLAQKGFIKISDKDKKEFMFSKTGVTDTSELRKYEQDVYDSIFKDGADAVSTKTLVTNTKFAKAGTELSNKAGEFLKNHKVFSSNPINTSGGYTFLGLFAICFGNILLGLAALILGRKSAERPDEGIQTYSEATSLKNFLVSQDAQIDFQAQEMIFFEKLLPYATAFGVEDIWIKRFKDLYKTNPEWFEGNDIVRLSALNSVVTNSFRTAAATTRSSSGFSSGFSGGSSGGGGGGGGGGSW